MTEEIVGGGLEILRPVARETLARRICDAIKAYIVSKNLEPGSQLPSERQLSELLAVSRNVLREGLSILVAEGVIVKRARRGIFLREMSQEALAREGARVLEQERARYDTIREARAAVELGAMGLIVSRISEEHLEHLEQTVVALERKVEQGGLFIREDMQFHLILLRAARNEFLLQWSPMVEEVMRAWPYESRSDAATSQTHKDEAMRVAAEHRAILDAIRRKDVQGAREILKKHLLIPDL
jgi:GntR family transcriptional repressor for pyruvate dehydrogenase complex